MMEEEDGIIGFVKVGKYKVVMLCGIINNIYRKENKI